MKKDALNIYDIAKMAGVSIATVSRVVNGSDKVSETTRQKVLAVIDEVDYTPNVFAQGLGLKTMHTVGILVPTIVDHYMATAVSYLERGFKEQGYDCILGCSGFDAEGKHAKTEMILTKHIDALVYVGSTYAGDGRDEGTTDYIREAAKQVPVFIINGSVEGDNIYCAVCEDEQASYEAASLLTSHGRKDILFLSDSRSYSAINKKKGYQRALSEAGLDPDEGVIFVDYDIHAVRDTLFRMDRKIDGILAVNDKIAAGAVKYAVESGIRIPGDIEIVGYNNSQLAISSTPEISSVDNYTELICDDTVSRLMKILDDREAKPQRETRFPCTLIYRETTG